MIDKQFKAGKHKSLGLTCFLLFYMLASACPQALALKLPKELKSCLGRTFVVARFRIDGAIETKNKELYIPTVPVNAQGEKGETVLKRAFPNKMAPLFLLFSDGYCFLKVVEVGGQRTVIPLDKLPPELQKPILATKLASDLIVPENFVLPSSLKSIAGNVSVSLKASPIVHPVSATKPGNVKNENKAIKIINDKIVESEAGWLLITSPGTGKVSMLNYPDLERVAEFSIQGTPSGITFANGLVYIADQTKSRILKLDPYKRKFLGQIDLPRGSTPKDVAALPDGKLIYVSENALADIAVFETGADKLFVRTKVHGYPGRMAIDPEGSTCIVLSVPDGKASLVSTRDQRFLSTLPVGSLPNSIAFDPNSKNAYITNRLSNTIAVLDLVHRGVILNLKTGSGPTGLVIDPNNKKLYVVNAKDNTISIFDTVSNKKLNDVRLPIDIDFPGALVLLPDKKHILLTSESTDAISLFDIDSQTFDKTQTIGHTSDQCVWVPSQKHISSQKEATKPTDLQ